MTFEVRYCDINEEVLFRKCLGKFGPYIWIMATFNNFLADLWPGVAPLEFVNIFLSTVLTAAWSSLTAVGLFCTILSTVNVYACDCSNLRKLPWVKWEGALLWLFNCSAEHFWVCAHAFIYFFLSNMKCFAETVRHF